MLRDGNGFSKIVICGGRVDLRKGIDGLAAYVRLNFNLNPFEKGTLYLFKGNRSDRIKGIGYEGIGMTMYTFRLNEGNRFQWPKNETEAVSVSCEQYQRLMDGYPLNGTIKETFQAVEMA